MFYSSTSFSFLLQRRDSAGALIQASNLFSYNKNFRVIFKDRLTDTKLSNGNNEYYVA
jgi:hypothetical protein